MSTCAVLQWSSELIAVNSVIEGSFGYIVQLTISIISIISFKQVLRETKRNRRKIERSIFTINKNKWNISTMPVTYDRAEPTESVKWE